ncbi:hypothetical protein HK102_009638, partial [Quaeritorhiza haematococci]
MRGTIKADSARKRRRSSPPDSPTVSVLVPPHPALRATFSREGGRKMAARSPGSRSRFHVEVPGTDLGTPLFRQAHKPPILSKRLSFRVLESLRVRARCALAPRLRRRRRRSPSRGPARRPVSPHAPFEVPTMTALRSDHSPASPSRIGSPRGGRRATVRPKLALESLEERQLLSTFTVDSLAPN